MICNRIAFVLLIALFSAAPLARAYPIPSYIVSENRHEELGLADGVWLASLDKEAGEVVLDRIHTSAHLVVIAADSFAGSERPLRNLGNKEKALRVKKAIQDNFRLASTIEIYDSAATYSRIREVFYKELPAKVGEDDLLFVYVALPARPGQGAMPVIIPFDGNWPRKGSISLDEFRDFSRSLPNRDAIFFFDMCAGQRILWDRANPKTLLPWTELSYIRRVKTQRNRLFLFASEFCPKKEDDVKIPELFSTAVAEELSSNRGYFIGSRFLNSLVERTRESARGIGGPMGSIWTIIEGEDLILVPDPERKISALSGEINVLNREKRKLDEWLQSPYARTDRKHAGYARRRLEDIKSEIRDLSKNRMVLEEKVSVRTETIERLWRRPR